MVSDEAMLDIANKFGLAMEQVYDIYKIGTMKAALLNIICIMITLLGIVFISALSVGILATANENSDSKWGNEQNTRTSVDTFNGEDFFNLCCIIGVLSTVWAFFVSVVFSNINDYILPEYHALRRLICP